MHRILLGGLGLALGVFARPAFAQQPYTPPARAAALGRPTAIPDPQPPSDITQTGLFRNGPARGTVGYPPGGAVGYPPGGTVTYAPGGGGFGAPTPVISQPPGMGGPPMVQPSPPYLVPSGPNVIESRGDPTGRAPGGVLVPSVAPGGGYDCPLGVDDPLCGVAPGYVDPGFADPGFAALRRVPGRGHGWVTGEVLLWWNRGNTVPALVTTSSPQFNGIIGQGDTRVLLGGPFGESFHVGGRIGAGYWFGDGECRGVDARLFWVSPSTATFAASTPPFPLLARPFFNVNGGVTTPNVGFGQSAEVVAGPGVATGRVTAVLKSTVWGAEANYRRYLAGGPAARVDLLVGYRYLEVNEQLIITEEFARVPGSNLTVGTPAVAGTITDSFRTENHFHGGQVGLAGTLQRGRWSLDSRATVALGSVHHLIDINGGQTLTLADGSTTRTAGGLLAVQGGNIGQYTQNRFAVVPEVGFNIGWQATERLRLFVGYNFLYLSSAVRPGEVIDTSLDAARVPNLLPPGSAGPVAGIPRPMPVFSTSGYFVQGISFGLTYRFGGGRW